MILILVARRLERLNALAKTLVHGSLRPYPEGLQLQSSAVPFNDIPVGSGSMAGRQGKSGSELAALPGVPVSRVLTGSINNPVLSVRGVTRYDSSSLLLDPSGLAGGADLPPSYRTPISCP